MESPLKVCFQGMEPSDAIEAKIKERVERLGRYYDRITSCRVVVESPHRHQHSGRRYSVHLDIGVPGGKVEVTRDSNLGVDHADPFNAVNDAFETAERRLREFGDRQRERA